MQYPDKKIYSVFFSVVLVFFLFMGCLITKSRADLHPPGLEPVVDLLNQHGIQITEQELKQKQSLDLFGANITDSDMELIKRLVWLRALNIGQTRTTKKALNYLKDALPRLEILNLTGLNLDAESILALNTFSNLKELVLAHTKNAAPNLGLLKTGSIQILDLSYSDFESLNQINQLPSLTHLYLNHVEAKNISWDQFQNWPALIHLEINQSGVVLDSNDWSKYLSQLNSLSLQDASVNKNSFANHHFNQLQALELSGSRIEFSEQLQFILNIETLKQINLSAITFFSKNPGDALLLSKIRDCRLESVILTDVDIYDTSLQFLSNCQKLRELDLEGTKVNGSFLKKTGFSNLQFLNLSRTRINSHNMIHLRKLSKLKTLWLQQVDIQDRDIIPILTLDDLRSLKLNNTRVGNRVSILPIRLKKLKRLEIIETRYNQAKAKQLQKNHPHILIEY